MKNEMTPLFIAHATAGTCMLVSGIVAMMTKKGQAGHRSSGKTYAVSVTAVAITGFVIAVMKSNQFLIATSVFVLYMMVSAYRSLYLKNLHKVRKAEPVDKAIIAFALAASLYLVGMGIEGLMHGNNGAVVSLVFGIICARFMIKDIMKFVKGPNDKKHWLYNHIAGMGGSYIAGTTAFLAVNAGYFSNNFQIGVWLGPAAVGTPLIIMSIRKYAKKPEKVKELPLKKGAVEAVEG